MVVLNITALTSLAASVALFNFVDFQNHVLDLGFALTADGSTIISQTLDDPPATNQQVSCILSITSPFSKTMIRYT